MPGSLSRIRAVRKSGSERFHVNGTDRDFSLRDFWSWSTSDLVSNATRGVLAEYIVAKATGAESATSVRMEWDAHDLTCPDGTKVEVKSAAFIQSWNQKDYSKPVFSIRKARFWDAETGEMASEPGRAADVYVFALLRHRDQDTLYPLDLDQWRFYVVATTALNERKRSQHSITLRSLEKISRAVTFAELASEVAAAAE